MSYTAIQVAKRMELEALIRRVCKLAGENEWFTAQYVKDVVKANYENLDGTLGCFRDVEKQLINKK